MEGNLPEGPGEWEWTHEYLRSYGLWIAAGTGDIQRNIIGDMRCRGPTRIVSMAKAFTGERLHRVFGDGIWNHGGMGSTWEHDGHIYLKQAKAWQNFLGSPGEHYDTMAKYYSR